MTEVAFRVPYESRADAESTAAELRDEGVETEISEEPGLFPLAVLLAVVIPPGVALLASVVSRIVKDWTSHGVLIDARGTGAPAVIKDADLPFGTVVILTRDGDKAERSELPKEDLGNYISSALEALSGGASASDAAEAADASTGEGSGNGANGQDG